jgi:hypothetical protein
MNKDTPQVSITTLDSLIGEWKQWAQDTDRSEEGWETSFPRWAEVVTACKAVMLQPLHTPEIAQRVGFCWALDEEDEELADFARQAISRTLDLVLLLTQHEDPKTRWQAYDVLGSSDESKAKRALWVGIRDLDPYVRRRALLAFTRKSQTVSVELVKIALEDPDPYIRRMALELAERTDDPAILAETRRALLADAADEVRLVVKSPAHDA